MNRKLLQKNIKNGQEIIKRASLASICKEYPNHVLSYYPLFTDNKKVDMEAVKNEFEVEMAAITSNEIHVYNHTVRYKHNDKDSYFRKFMNDYRERGEGDEIIFIDPDSGFYADYSNELVDITKTINDKQIDIQTIKKILFNVSAGSFVVCYQFMRHNAYIKAIDTELEKYIERSKASNMNISLDASTYQKQKVKLYVFTYSAT